MFWGEGAKYDLVRSRIPHTPSPTQLHADSGHIHDFQTINSTFHISETHVLTTEPCIMVLDTCTWY